MNKPDGCKEAVHIGNPKTAEFQVHNLIFPVRFLYSAFFIKILEVTNLRLVILCSFLSALCLFRVYSLTGSLISGNAKPHSSF